MTAGVASRSTTASPDGTCPTADHNGGKGPRRDFVRHGDSFREVSPVDLKTVDHKLRADLRRARSRFVVQTTTKVRGTPADEKAGWGAQRNLRFSTPGPVRCTCLTPASPDSEPAYGSLQPPFRVNTE